MQAYRGEQVQEQFPHGGIIVYDEDHGLFCPVWHQVSLPSYAGSVNMKAVPWGSSRRRPQAAAMRLDDRTADG